MSVNIYKHSENKLINVSSSDSSIDDETISVETTFSSEKITTDFVKKINREYKTLTWTGAGTGFNEHLDDVTSGSLNTIKEKFLVRTDERWVLDLGEHWNSIATLYMFNRLWQRFFINATPTSRIIELPQMGGQIRFGVNSEFAYTSEIKLYKEKRDDYIPNNSMETYDFSNKNIFTFGDSIAYGYIADAENHETKLKITQIVAQILQCSELTKNNSNNKAVSGSTWSNVSGRTMILSTLQENLSNIRTDNGVILLMAGINDYWLGVNISNFRNAVKETLDWILQNSSCKVVVVSPIDYQPGVITSNIGSTSTLDMFRAVLSEETIRRGCYYINGKDIGFNSTQAAAFPMSNLFSDGLHPNSAGYYFYGLRLTEFLTGVKLGNDVKEGYSWTGQMVLGHPIYRYVTTDTNASSLNLAFSNIRVVNMFGTAQDGTNVVPLNFNRTDGTLSYMVFVNQSAGTVNFEKSTYNTKRLLVIDFYLED